MIRWLLNLFRPTPFGANRSSRWPAVRKAHLAKYPACECCGNTKDCEVHHKIPVSVDPERELDPTNLMTLCERGPGGLNCHIVIGHCGNTKTFNPTAMADAHYIGRMLRTGRFR